jgi:hypothetical protein
MIIRFFSDDPVDGFDLVAKAFKEFFFGLDVILQIN